MLWISFSSSGSEKISMEKEIIEGAGVVEDREGWIQSPPLIDLPMHSLTDKDRRPKILN